MSRILSLPGLTAAVWVSYLGFVGLLAALLMGLAYHPHFLPVTTMLVLVIVSGPALILVASWPIIRGPAGRRALTCLLIGAALLWSLAGGLHATAELKVVDRRFGPAPEQEFDPNRFPDGPRVFEATPEAGPAESSLLAHWYWLPVPSGMLCLAAGPGSHSRLERRWAE